MGCGRRRRGERVANEAGMSFRMSAVSVTDTGSIPDWFEPENEAGYRSASLAHLMKLQVGG